jgi:hypothetical protein
MSSELLNGDKIMPDGSKRTYVNGLVTFIAYPAGTTRAQMILPKEINRLEGIQAKPIGLPTPTYTSNNLDDYQKAIAEGIKASINTSNSTSNSMPNSEIDYIFPTDVARIRDAQDLSLPTPSPTQTYTSNSLDDFQRAIDKGIKDAAFNTMNNSLVKNDPLNTLDNTLNTSNNVYKNVPDFTSDSARGISNNTAGNTSEEPSFLSKYYIPIIIVSIAMIIMLVLVFVYKNKKSMNVENIIASFGLI